MKKLLSVIALMLVLLLAACGEPASISKVEPEKAPVSGENPADDSEKAEKEEEPVVATPETFAMGDTVRFDNLEITLNGARVDEGSEYFKPSNEFYLILDVTLENKGTEPKHVSSMLNFSLHDADFFELDMGLFAETKGSLDGEIGPGRTMRGEIAFDVDESEYYEFIFEEFITSGQAIWKFSIEE